jgi:hypothetical protein
MKPDLFIVIPKEQRSDVRLSRFLDLLAGGDQLFFENSALKGCVDVKAFWVIGP